MPKIPDDIIRTIEERARIEEVVGDIVGYAPAVKGGLHKAGVNLTCLCPFHDDQHDGNFIVRPSTVSERNGGNTYRCFVCNAKGGPVQFLMAHERLSFPDAIRWLGKRYSIPVDDVPVNWTPPPAKPAPPPLPYLALPMNMVTARENCLESPLVKWLCNHLWDSVQIHRLPIVLQEYHVGWSAQKGMTIFWLIDEENLVRTGKMMRYQEDGHRVKEKGYNNDWVHSALSRRWDKEKRQWVYETPYPYPDIFNPDEQRVKQTLFGMHLLKKYPQATVRIVESEKTALIMATAYGNHQMDVWMACGGKGNINRDVLMPLIREKRKIVLYPDRDAVSEWRERLVALNYDRITMDTQAVTKWWQEQDGEKADIADVVLRMIDSHARGRIPTIEDIIKNHPEFAAFARRLQLTTNHKHEGEREPAT